MRFVFSTRNRPLCRLVIPPDYVGDFCAPVFRNKMKPLLIALPGNDQLRDDLARELEADHGVAILRHFPDGESYVRVESSCKGRDVVLLATLAQPDDKLLPLIFTADLTRELGAARVILTAPYLAYMRQDKRFLPGEAVTSKSFAYLLSNTVDALVTVDPHLHRYSNLDELYSIPTRVVHAAPAIAAWIEARIPQTATSRPGLRKRTVGRRCRRSGPGALRGVGKDPYRRPGSPGLRAQGRTMARPSTGIVRRHHLHSADHDSDSVASEDRWIAAAYLHRCARHTRPGCV